MFKRLTAGVLLALVVPSVAIAKPPTRQHATQYLRAYHTARREFGAQAVGCNLLERRGSCHVKATDHAVLISLEVLDRLIAPPPAPITTSTTVSATLSQAPMYVASAPSPSASSSGSASGLAACIIQHESGGNPQAVSPNGKYKGIGQWQQSTWVADGGTRYAPTPLGASYSQQAIVLNGEGTAGMQAQQGQYDGC